MRHWFRPVTRCRNINLLAIVYAFQPRLRDRLTLGGFTFPRKPKAFGEQDSHLFYRYSCRHNHLLTLHRSFRYGFHADSNALLPRADRRSSRLIRSFGVLLIPVHYRRRTARPVSYYALFKWWLLLSQHPGCHSNSTSLRTQQNFGTLAGDPGCFPLDHGCYHSQSYSRDSLCSIRSLVEVGRLVVPYPHSVALPPQRSGSRLAQKLFRRERDISRFD
jgi:hypothetical protein